MNVFAIQLNTVWENKQANFARAQTQIELAAPPPSSLVVLPEMFACGFSMNTALIADGPERETEAFLSGIALRYRICVLGGVARRIPDGRAFNEAVAFGPDGAECARYCKLHPFSLAGEDAHYTAGKDIVTFPWEGFSVAPAICYDLRFPELFRNAVRRGATLFCVIANWPSVRHDHWTTLLRARAIENQCCVAAVNRCGTDPKHEYAGGSLIIDSRGRTLAEAGSEECVVRAELNPQDVAEWRREFPALRDART